MSDHSLLHPTMMDQELEGDWRLTAKYGAASVCIKPYAVAGGAARRVVRISHGAPSVMAS